MINVIGISGSLRRLSYNSSLLRAAQELAPEGMSITIYELNDIPLYNNDVEQQGDPAPVAAFKRAIGAADALLISTPEYQRSVPGVLKNALDWASRPAGKSVLRQKPVAIMGASPGMTGTARAQTVLREVLCYSDMRVLSRPEILIAFADDKFDAQGRFTDEDGRKYLQKMLTALSRMAAGAGD
jgi:chromate reductase